MCCKLPFAAEDEAAAHAEAAVEAASGRLIIRGCATLAGSEPYHHDIVMILERGKSRIDSSETFQGTDFRKQYQFVDYQKMEQVNTTGVRRPVAQSCGEQAEELAFNKVAGGSNAR